SGGGSMGFLTFLNQAISRAYTSRRLRARNVVARPLPHAAELALEIGQRGLPPGQIVLRRLDDEQRRRRVMKKEVIVGLVELTQVRVAERRELRIGSLAFAGATAENVGRRLQVQHEIRLRDVLGEQLVQTLIDEELVVVQVQIGVNLVSIEQVVADGEL